MKHEDPLVKAYKQEITAKLQKAKAKLDGFEATAKERKAQAEIHTITALRAKRDEIHAKLLEFETVGEARAAQIKAELEGKVADFEKEVSKLAGSLKSHATHR